jgi:hypothetical protein
LGSEVVGDRYVMRVGYFTNAPGVLRLSWDGGSEDITVGKGLHEVDLVVSGTFDDVRAELVSSEAPGGTVCVTGLEVGLPVPDEAP